MKEIDRSATIVLVTTPVTLVFLGVFLRLVKRNSRLIIVVHDVYPDNLVVAGLLTSNSFAYKSMDKVFTWAFSKMDCLVVLGRDMQAIFQKKGICNIRVIENWAEKNLACKPCDPSNFQRSETVFLFAGNLGRLQGIAKLLDAIELTEDASVKFIFAGVGVMVDEIKSRVKNSKKIEYLGPYARSEQAEIFEHCDVGVVSLAPGMFGLGVPSKSYNLMIAGKPIFYLGDRNSEFDLVIQESACGWFCDASCSAQDVAKKIDSICASLKNELNEVAQNSYELGVTKYTEAAALNSYVTLLSEMSVCAGSD